MTIMFAENVSSSHVKSPIEHASEEEDAQDEEDDEEAVRARGETDGDLPLRVASGRKVPAAIAQTKSINSRCGPAMTSRL